MNYVAVIPTRVSGIPCQIGVTSYHRQAPFRGSPWHCESDWDYYGYTECEWSLLDRRGRVAEWLERKLIEKTKDEIEKVISAHFECAAAEHKADVAIARYENSRDDD